MLAALFIFLQRKEMKCCNMAFWINTLYLGVCMSALMVTDADEHAPKAENVRWVSLDFKTILMWTASPSDYTFTVKYSWDDGDWMVSPNCIGISETECDLSIDLEPITRTFTADIQTEPESDGDYELEELPHTYSPPFNPYKQSEISAAEFSVEVVEEGKVSVIIKDPLTSFHKYGKQLTIRDILKNDLQYKISYYKSGNTGKKDILSNSNRAEVSGLDAGQSYCFMVAAFIPSRIKPYQQGAWSIQQCTPGQKNVLQELSLGALVGGLFIVLVILIIIITVTVLCCRRRSRPSQTYQSSTVV
ncbi:tissue factor-like [Dunckerocampus dactyliophorus]|uniref:tissue factor-like n=1 Tax=Dunckerocampus dactyliophorus TaxID=161453 RepID=UPI002404EC8D|nr:tissue factor-like [Dunckerocampus dactyliophorus]